VSSTFNFVLAELWVFGVGRFAPRAWTRFAWFLLMSDLALVVRAPMMWALVDVGGVHYLIANLLSLVVLTIVRFAVADRVIWRNPLSATSVGEDELTLAVGAGPLLGPEVEELPTVRPGATDLLDVEPLDGGAGALPQPSRRAQRIGLVVVMAAAALLRLWGLMAVGFNSDEAVYASQAAGIAGDHTVSQLFPIFRAHPFLFQAILSVPYQLGTSDLVGRLASVGFGLATVALVFATTRRLYGPRAALVAAGIVALMPYHVIVTRQVLLDGPMTFFATLTLYFTVRFVVSKRVPWLLAAACALGLTTLTKETYVILLGSLFVFFALSPEVRLRARDVAAAGAVLVLTLLPYPITILAAGKSETGKSYLSWQLFRRPNHGYEFYVTTLPSYIGWLVLAGAVVAVTVTWGARRTWRERLLLSWILVPAGFLTIWPVKGFHYLLAAAVPLAMLGAVGIDRLVVVLAQRARRSVDADGTVARSRRWATIGPAVVLAIVAVSLLVPSWRAVQPPSSDSFLAGLGGLPGAREVGEWVDANTPEGARFMTVGPSMANIVQWYGHREAHGLSVSPNPLNRNPSYEPIVNPDRAIRTNELQYVVWDAYSTQRSSFFGDKVVAYSDRYHGRPVFTYEADGEPVIVVYEVRP
jgi:putative flippase GtrA